jgi:hypothetical protein
MQATPKASPLATINDSHALMPMRTKLRVAEIQLIYSWGLTGSAVRRASNQFST